jgi:hypothetical protein
MPVPREAFAVAERRLARLLPRHPRLAFSGADHLGRLRNRLSRRWPSPEQVRALFPELGSEAATVAWRIGGLEALNRLWVEGLRQWEIEPLRPLVRTPPAFAGLRPPLLLGFLHTGAVHALVPAFEQLPGPVIAVRHSLLHPARPPVAQAETAGGRTHRRELFQRLLAHLRDGGFVATALDVAPGAGISAPCLGHRLRLASGPLGLARLSGVPIVPVVGRFREGWIEAVLGEPLATPSLPREEAVAWESALAASISGWLERYLRSAPGELGLGLLRNLLGTDQVG